MKYSVNQGSISNFVVGGARSECGPPVAVYMKKQILGTHSDGFFMLRCGRNRICPWQLYDRRV
ncbi:hypothetical protein [Desulfocicer vacuolatum]|uniref:hypothetical protein n=1 Tax=Desulfocicer vacuolatum TaxID=2298 RepID=UPI001BB06486|nr:hypothetical protein [Desulfocicer vacuolatum]